MSKYNPSVVLNRIMDKIYDIFCLLLQLLVNENIEIRSQGYNNGTNAKEKHNNNI